ncbi:hypothetical protein OQE43_09155 [Bacillus velezensis]|uniref:hypothetical protein n=1 Tax=Bacillus velezensis TaxID=492670 RepID=UPI00224A9F52|nr:hypothetical protein [Bacillus velezensis]MCX2884493.1 hypothetical protein [Bacillus velezensis]
MEQLTIYEQIMKDPSFRKAALVKFGFGQVAPVKVEKWLKDIIRLNIMSLSSWQSGRM